MYLDVDIAILPRSGDSYPVTLHAPGGDARGVFVFPDDADFAQLVARLATLDTNETTLNQIGQRLFNALFHGQTRDVLARTQGICEPGQQLRLRLSIAAEEGKIAALPWELLHDPDGGPLVLTDTPLVRYLPLPTRVPTIAASLPLKVLLTSVRSAANVATVVEEIRGALGTLGDHAQVTVEPNLTMPIFQRRLREGYHVWHFVGQGGTSDSAQGGVLLFSDGGSGTKAVSASQLAVLLGSSGVRLVVLDASAGARLATDPFRSIAPALMRTQIPTVVAMQFSTGGESGQAFAGEFYRSLAEGFSIDACVTEGRRAVMGWSGLERPDWATPIVYSRAPDSRLFNVPRADMVGRIVTLGGTPGLPAHTSLSVHSEWGTLLNAGPRPTVERLAQRPRPPRPVRSFFNRERELRALLGEIGPRQGAWVRGPAGAGISALLRQAANTETPHALGDGVVLLNNVLDPADADDAVQEIFERYYTSNVSAKLPADSAKSYLGDLHALFLFDRLPLTTDELSALADIVAGSAVLIAANGPAPDTLQDVVLGPLPRQDATKLIGAESAAEIDLSNVMFLDRICAALGDIPLALQLAGRLLRTNTVATKQLVALVEEPGEYTSALARAAAISLKVLEAPELAVLAVVVRGGPSGLAADAIGEISQIPAPQLDTALEKLGELKLIQGGGNRHSPTTLSLGRVLDQLLQPGDQRKRAAAFFAGAALLHAGNLDWLAAETGNLVQAAETLLADGKANQAGALLKTIQPMAVLHGKWGLWQRIIESAERAATAANDPALKAWALHERGTRAGLLGESSVANAALAGAQQAYTAANNHIAAEFSQHNMRHIGLAPAPPLPLTINAPTPLPRRLVGIVVTVSILLAVLALLAPRVGWPFGRDIASAATASATHVPVVLAATNTATPTRTTAPTPTALSTALSTPTEPATSAPRPTAGPLACRVAAARLNVRAGPGTNYQVLATLADGQAVTPTGRSADNRWLRVRTEGIADGWVSADATLLACNRSTDDLNLAEAPASPTPTRRPRPTARPTVRPTLRPTATPAPPTETPSPELPTPTSSTTPTLLPKATPTYTPTPTLLPTETPLPTATPRFTPSPTLTPTPTLTATIDPKFPFIPRPTETPITPG